MKRSQLVSSLVSGAHQTAQMLQKLAEALKREFGNGVDTNEALMLIAKNQHCADLIAETIAQYSITKIAEIGEMVVSQEKLSTLLTHHSDMNASFAESLYDNNLLGEGMVEYEIWQPTITMKVITAFEMLMKYHQKVRHTTLRELAALRKNQFYEGKLKDLDQIFASFHLVEGKAKDSPCLCLNNLGAIHTLKSAPKNFAFLMARTVSE